MISSWMRSDPDTLGAVMIDHEFGWTLLLALVLGLVSAGCPSQPAPQPPVDEKRPVVDDRSEVEIATLRGELVWGHEVRSFTECGSTQALWFVDEAGGEIQRIHQELASEPYQALFFEIRGRRGPRLEAGFAADHPGSVTRSSDDSST